MTFGIFLIALGVVFAGLAGVALGRANRGGSVGVFRRSKRSRAAKKVYFAAVLLGILGGLRVWANGPGLWAIPIAAVPLLLAAWVPLAVHNARQVPA